MHLQNDIAIHEYSALSKINSNDLKQKKLLLNFSVFQDEMEAAIIDVSENSVLAAYSYISNQKKFSTNELLFLINDFISRYHLHQFTFQNIHIIFSSPHFTLCPDEFYLPEKKDVLLRFTHPLSADEMILTDSFENIKVIYGIHQPIYQSISKTFPSARLLHSSAAMMNLFFYHPFLIHAQIWAHIHPNYIEIVAKKDKQLLFYNTFDTSTSIDILYYVLFCIQQINFNPKETDVFLSGNISLKHTIFQLLQKYVHSVQPVHHHNKLHILPLNPSLISHHHFISLNHHLCVSYPENTKAEK